MIASSSISLCLSLSLSLTLWTMVNVKAVDDVCLVYALIVCNCRLAEKTVRYIIILQHIATVTAPAGKSQSIDWSSAIAAASSQQHDTQQQLLQNVTRREVQFHAIDDDEEDVEKCSRQGEEEELDVLSTISNAAENVSFPRATPIKRAVQYYLLVLHFP